MTFNKKYYEYFLENKAKFDIYERIALDKVIKYYNDEYTLVHMCDNYKYDFKLSNNKTYEIKAEPYALKSHNFYIEHFDNFNNKLSGIATTESNYYIITDTRNYYIIKTRKLKKICESNLYSSIINKNRTATGFIIPVSVIIEKSVVI